MAGMRSSRWLTIAALAALPVLVAAIWFLTSARGGDDSAAPPSGLVFVEGDYIDPPYVVTARDLEIRVNDLVIRSGTRPSTGRTAHDVPAAPANAPEVLAAVAERFASLGGSSAASPPAAAVTALESFARSFAVIADVRHEGDTLVLVDTSSEEAVLLMRRPEPSSEGEIQALLTAEAAKLQAVLDTGGGLLADGGVVLTVPASGLEAFLGDLRAVFDLDPGAREGAMLELIGSIRLSSSLLAAGTPPDRQVAGPLHGRSALALAGTPLAEPVRFVADPFGIAAPRTPSIHGNHGDYRTPSSNKAYLFTPVSAESINCHTAPVIEAADLHSYSVLQFDGAASNTAEFAASSGRAGIFYSCIHGGTAYEMHPDRASAQAAQAAYTRQGLTGTQVGSLDDGAKWYVMTSTDFIRRHWRSANTIAYIEGCSAANLHSAFNAREFISTFELCTPGDNEGLNHDFWGRLAGTVGDGRTRSVGDAFAIVFQGTIFRLFGSGGGKTVLVPAVRDFQPEVLVPVSPTVPIRGTVRFDAEMDRVISTGRMIDVTGACDAELVDERWIDAYTYEFYFVTKRPGPLTFTVSSTWATSSDDLGLHLDGNQNPERTDHVGPSFDDWNVTLECVAGEPTPTPTVTETVIPTETPGATAIATGTTAATSTPTSETESPTATAGPRETATAVTTPTAGATTTPSPDERVGLNATPGEGEVLVFLLDGVFFSPAGLGVVAAHEPFCAYEHVHGPTITSLIRGSDGQYITRSEHLGECGFGPPNFYIIPDPR